MSDRKDTEIGKEYDNLSTEELKEKLKTAFLDSEEITDDTMEELDRLMAELRKREPLDHERSAQESWKVFRQEHREELSQIGVRNQFAGEVMPSQAESDLRMKRQSRRPLLRVGLVAAVIVVLLFAVTVVAGAKGFDLWGWIPLWESEDLRFATETPEDDVLRDSNIHDIRSALNELVITEPVYPSWIPEGFVYSASVIEADPIFLHELYTNNGQELSITITPSSGADSAVYQREDTFLEEYFTNHTIHYVFQDINHFSVVWNTEHYTVLMIGNLSLEEMKRIIDSVYEVTN